MPAMPAHNAAPLGAPRPSLPTHEPAASPQLQRDFDERASRQPIPPPDARLDRVPGHNSGRTRRYSRVAAVILVVLAAAVAAAAVYFVLSQLT
jgi:hypothetical protein